MLLNAGRICVPENFVVFEIVHDFIKIVHLHGHWWYFCRSALLLCICNLCTILIITFCSCQFIWRFFVNQLSIQLACRRGARHDRVVASGVRVSKIGKFCNFLAGSFSAVSQRIFARKYAFDSIFHALQDLHTFAPLQSQNFRKKSVWKISNFRENSAHFF